MSKYKHWVLPALRDHIRATAMTIKFLEAELREMRKEKFQREAKKRAIKALKVIGK